MTTNVFSRIAELDPAREPEATPDWDTLAPVLLSFLDERTMPMKTQTPQKVQQDQPKRRRGWLVAVAAFAVVIVFGLTAALLSNQSTDGEPAATATTATEPTTPTTATEPTTPTTATEPTMTPAEAIAVANAYLVAFNAGDADAEMALFAPDATVNDNFRESVTLEEEQLRNTWNAAQGTKLTTEGCTAVDAPASTQRVICRGATYSALVQAVGAPPVPTTVAMTIGPNGITRLSYNYGQPDFNHVSIPFERWMQANHAEIDVPYDWGQSIEEAEASGLLLAQYAAEWAAHLEAKGCTYLDGC